MAFKLSGPKLFCDFYKNSSRYMYYSTQAKGNFYDIIISGGNLIGQTVACALSKHPVLKKHSILLVGSSNEKIIKKTDRYSNRVSSIVPSTKRFFEDIGMWKNIHRYHSVKDMKVWGNFSNDFLHVDMELPVHIIENDVITNAALIENRKAENLKIIYNTLVEEIILNEDFNKPHKIKLEDGNIYETTLLIGSDGAGSLVRKAINTNYISWDYDHSGIVATLHLSDNEDQNTTAWQRFVSDGIIAILPLGRGLSSLVWSTSKQKSKDLLQLPDEIFVDALNEAVQSKPSKNEVVDAISFYAKGIINSISSTKNMSTLAPPYIQKIDEESRAAFPLGFGHASNYIKDGVALVGDAAHKVHPLAGQGVNIGFRDVRTLQNKLVEGILNGRPVGHIIDLKHYETECLRNNVPIMASIEFFYQIYSSKFQLVQAFGNVGFSFVNSITPIKNFIKSAASA